MGAGEPAGAGESIRLGRSQRAMPRRPRNSGRTGPASAEPMAAASRLHQCAGEWDAKTGAGIAWKVPAPASGFGSPIVWGNRVFLSGGDARKREVLCLDAKTGRTLWRQPVANGPAAPQAGDVPDSTGLCRLHHGYRRPASVCLLRKWRLRGLHAGRPACLVQELWRAEESLRTRHLPGDLADRLIVQLDQGDNEDGNSKLYALDGRTGRSSGSARARPGLPGRRLLSLRRPARRR